MKTRQVVLHNENQAGPIKYLWSKAVSCRNCETSNGIVCWLNDLSVRGCQSRVWCSPAYEDAQVGNFIQMKRRYTGWCGDSDEVGTVDGVEVEGRASVGLGGLDLDVAHLEVVNVAKVKTLRGGIGAEHL